MKNNSTSQDQHCTYGTFTSGYCDYSNITISCDCQHLNYLNLFLCVLTWITICISLLLTLLAIYLLYSEVRNDHVFPVDIINLLISDLIQLSCVIVFVAPYDGRIKYVFTYYIHNVCLEANVGFMVCIALKRYLAITCPLWYRFRRNINCCVFVCVVVWVLPLFNFLSYWFWDDYEAIAIIWGIFLLLPLPLFVFFLGGALKALSTSTVPTDEKRRILGILFLVLLIYTLLFLPRIITYLTHTRNFTFWILSFVLLRLSPLADLLLYVFMRKGTINKLLASVCCSRIDRTDTSISTA